MNRESRKSMAVGAVVALLAAGMASTAQAKIWYVWQDATGSNDGGNWTNAFTELRSALSAASAGDDIWVAEGRYRQTHPVPRAGFLLRDDVDLYGGLPAGALSLDDQDPTAYPTYLSGDRGVIDDISDNSYTVLIADGVDCTVDGFIIKRGNSDGGTGPHHSAGGAIWMEDSTIRLYDCRVTENNAQTGGGIYVGSDSHLIARRCKFDANLAATGSGGAVEIAPAQDDGLIPRAVFECCKFEENYAHSNGGAIDNQAVLSAYSCLFYGNGTWLGDGGAINVEPSIYTSLYLANLTVVYNDAGGYGGGLSAEHADYEVYNSIFWDNLANLTNEFPHYQIHPINMCFVEHCCIQNLDSISSYLCDWNDASRENFGDYPLFLDPANGNFRLQRFSHCVDAGDETFYPYGYPVHYDADLAGNDRVEYGGVIGFGPEEIDVGAYEVKDRLSSANWSDRDVISID
jgi:hypothetical protein